MRECEKGIENVLNAIQAGILTPSTKERLESLEKRRDELKAELLRQQLERPKYIKLEIVKWISRFKYGSIDDKAYQNPTILLWSKASTGLEETMMKYWSNGV